MAKADLTGAATGLIGGASTGGAIGGLPGALIGGVAGGVAGLFGKKKKKKKVSTLDKRQQRLNELEHQGVLGEGPLADLYNYNPDQANDVFEKTIANPAYRNFKEQVIPEITGQFRSAGLGSSSYAGDALAKEGRNVQESLDAKRAKFLYDEQQGARSAKRSSIENLQNRQTTGYDYTDQGGFDIGKILKSIAPEDITKLKEYFTKSPAAAGV